MFDLPQGLGANGPIAQPEVKKPGPVICLREGTLLHFFTSSQ
jgi:hypothetical protein